MFKTNPAFAWLALSDFFQPSADYFMGDHNRHDQVRNDLKTLGVLKGS